ncbi:hypothetical protein C0J52_18525 [Blattella germanica]|nr:hypothetical protein C0J52_18525 [Blattella germanica]
MKIFVRHCAVEGKDTPYENEGEHSTFEWSHQSDSHCEMLHKMTTSKVEKAYCALEFARRGAVVTVQRFNKPAPHRNWVRQLQETGCLCPKKSPGRPRNISRDC